MKQNEKSEMAAVEALLAVARDDPAKVPDALVTRVLADSEKVQPAPRAHGQKKSHLMTRLKNLVGGWQGLGGLAAATCAGVWIGLSPPEAMPDAGALLLGYEVAEFTSTTAELTSFGWDAEEG
ncbi:MAG: hypothetical protein R8G34_22150 [Paracoccaceae bacterium]|nr:hypothetical protein [Paracoccaceae bacterium]